MQIVLPRFSLSTLMGAVVVVAAACAALRFASELWASIWFTLTVAVLLLGILGLVFSERREARAYWAGSVLFGWAYILMVFAPWFGRDWRGHIVTDRILHIVHEKLAARAAARPSPVPGTTLAVRPDQGVGYYDPRSGLPVLVFPDWKDFSEVGHSICGLMTTILGGVLAQSLLVRQQHRK